MKKSHPNELAYRLAIEPDCSLDSREFEPLILRTFDRLWLRPVPVAPGVPFLQIRIWCQKTGIVYPFTIVADFATIANPYANPESLGVSYESRGAGSYYEFRLRILEVLRRALQDHVSANFDL